PSDLHLAALLVDPADGDWREALVRRPFRAADVCAVVGDRLRALATGSGDGVHRAVRAVRAVRVAAPSDGKDHGDGDGDYAYSLGSVPTHQCPPHVGAWP